MYDESKDAAGNYPVKDIPLNTYFRKVDKYGTPQQRVYIRGAYCRMMRKYEITPADDINANGWMKGATLVNVGFDY